jgi:hypothetical protein
VQLLPNNAAAVESCVRRKARQHGIVRHVELRLWWIMPRDRSAGTFNLFTTSFLLAPIPLSQTFFAPYRSQRSAAPTTIGSLAYVDRYQSTGLPWIVILFLPLAPLQFVLVAFRGLPRLDIAICLGAWNRSHELGIFFFTLHSW